jgi:hypothetical protein
VFAFRRVNLMKSITEAVTAADRARRLRCRAPFPCYARGLTKTIFYSCNSQLWAVRPTFVADAFLRQVAGGTPKLRLNARLKAASDS